ncbi:hypothetical protein KGP36_02600 [Patescibacteria group bacterium]|nr:hypothetical protein [Patescibacteria group bacterium]
MGNQYTQYFSTDASAPSLTQADGSLLTVLDAILVNGYGTKPSAGWTKAFTNGTDISVYQAPSGVRHYMQVVDNQIASTYQYADCIGFTSMSAYNAGTGQFGATGSGFPKGAYGPVSWIAFADSRTLIFFCQGNGSISNSWCGCYFGEIYSVQTNDSFRSLVKAYTRTGGVENLGAISASIATPTPSASMPAGYTGVGSQVNVSATGDNAKSGGATVLKGIVPFPNPEEGGLYLSPVWIADPTTSPTNNIRGRMRGFWHTLHPNTSINHLQTFTGIGDLAGRSFIAIKPTGDVSASGTFMIEISATLETN